MKSRGFTLIELMIVIAILAILTAIAVPIYTSQVEKSRRADAVSELLATAQELERCYTRNNTYSDCVTSPFDTDNGYYEITVAIGGSGTTYDLTATAKASGPQSGDDCSPFELDHLGNRDAGSTNDRCWGSD